MRNVCLEVKYLYKVAFTLLFLCLFTISYGQRKVELKCINDSVVEKDKPTNSSLVMQEINGVTQCNCENAIMEITVNDGIVGNKTKADNEQLLKAKKMFLNDLETYIKGKYDEVEFDINLVRFHSTEEGEISCVFYEYTTSKKTSGSVFFAKVDND